jgi:hypothetical protein
LEQFLTQQAGEPPKKPVKAQQQAQLAAPDASVTPIDLFGPIAKDAQEPAQEPVAAPVATKEVEMPAETEDGDFFGPPEPEFARVTETQTAKAKKKQEKAAKQVEQVRPLVHPNRNSLQILDKPAVGGKVTICVLCFGDHHQLHRRCLTSIVETVPPSRMDLRVATNQVCLDTKNYLNTLPITHVYENNKVRRKYQAMREMFHDPERPITSKWVLWFDDDSYARKPDWLVKLGTAISEIQDPDIAMLGVKMMHPLKSPKGKDPRKWFHNAIWWRGVPFQTKQGREAANGNMIHFIVGGFWALRTDAIKRCQIPGPRLNHNGGDILIGEQLHQQGLKLKLFNKDKEFIHTSASPRRGFHEVFPWYR